MFSSVPFAECSEFWLARSSKTSTSSVRDGYFVTGSSRLDFAVKCAPGTNSEIVVGRNRVVASLTGKDGGSGISVYNGGHTPWLSTRPAYLRDLRNLEVDQTYSVSMTAVHINGYQWDPVHAMTEFRFDTIQEWSISGSSAHPLRSRTAVPT